MGTVGVLALAKYKGLIQEIKPIIDELIKATSRYPREYLKDSLEN